MKLYCTFFGHKVAQVPGIPFSVCLRCRLLLGFAQQYKPREFCSRHKEVPPLPLTRGDYGKRSFRGLKRAR